MCCFLSLLVGSLGLRGLALFQTLCCGYSSAPSAGCRVCLELLLPFFKHGNVALVSGLAGFGLIGSVIAGAGSPIRLRLLSSKYPRDCSVSNHTQDQSSHLQFTVNEVLLGLPMANS
ncbi:hypothetical protein Bca101_038645 [Brassica carinata]